MAVFQGLDYHVSCFFWFLQHLICCKTLILHASHVWLFVSHEHISLVVMCYYLLAIFMQSMTLNNRIIGSTNERCGSVSWMWLLASQLVHIKGESSYGNLMMPLQILHFWYIEVMGTPCAIKSKYIRSYINDHPFMMSYLAQCLK